MQIKWFLFLIEMFAVCMQDKRINQAYAEVWSLPSILKLFSSVKFVCVYVCVHPCACVSGPRLLKSIHVTE